MATRFTVSGVFRAVDRMTGPIRQMERQVSGFSDKAYTGFRDVSRAVDFFKTAIVAVGVAAAAMAVAVIAAIRDVINSGMDLDSAMAGVAARFRVDRASEEFGLLEAAARNAGATTQFSAVEAADALSELGATGLEAADAVAVLPGILDFATAATVELGAASDQLTDTLSAFELAASTSTEQAESLARVSEVTSFAVNASSMSFEQFAEAISNASTQAHSAGISLEETSAALGILADAGEKGSRAGSRFSSMLSDLQTPTTAARREMRRLHIATRDADGSFLPLVDIVRNMEGALGGMNDAARDAALARIFGEQGLRPMRILLSAGSERLGEFTGELKTATDVTAGMAATMRDTAAGDVASLTNAIEEMKLQVWELVRGPFREVVGAVTDWVRANKEIIASGITDALAWLERNTWAVYAAATVLVGVLVIIAGLLSIVALTILMMSLPFILLGIAIYGIVQAFNYLAEVVPPIAETVADAFVSAWEFVSDAFVSAGEAIMGVFESIGGFFSSLWTDTIRPVGTAILEFLVGLWTLSHNALRIALIDPTIYWIGVVAAMFMAVWEPIAAFFVDLWDQISTVFMTGWALLLAGVEYAVARVREIWEPIGGFFSELWEGIKSTAIAIWDGIVERVMSVVTAIQVIWKPIAGFFANLWDGIVNYFLGVFSRVTETIGAVVNFVRGVGAETMGEEGRSGAVAQVIGPEERVARSISESTTTERGELVIRDETGRGEMTRRPRGNIINIQHQPSGAT